MFRLLYFIVPLLLASCAGGGSPQLKSEKDTLAYILGMTQGVEYRTVEPLMNPDIIMAGMKTVLNGDTLLISQTDGRDYLTRYVEEIVPARLLKESEELLAGVLATNKNARVTESGLVYEILVEGTGERADYRENRYAEIVYSGIFPDGSLLDPETSLVVNVIDGYAGIERDFLVAGLCEGATLINGGGKIRLWVPPHLAYGVTGDYDVRPNQALIYELEVVKVDSKNDNY